MAILKTEDAQQRYEESLKTSTPKDPLSISELHEGLRVTIIRRDLKKTVVQYVVGNVHAITEDQIILRNGVTLVGNVKEIGLIGVLREPDTEYYKGR